MPSSGILCRVALVRTDVSKEFSASIIRVTRIGELRSIIQWLVTARSLLLVILMMEAICSTEMSVLTRATRHHIPEDGILHVIKIIAQN
jgi:hypothetical protein